jgi:cell division protein FtsL
VSPAEPGKQRRLEDLIEEPVGEEPVHGTAPAVQEGQERSPQLRLVRQQARRRANRRHLVVSIAIGTVAVVCMGLVALHVLIAENQFQLDNLQQQASAQQANYEKLRLNVAQLEAPSRIVSVAEGKLGMRQPGSVTYLPATSASAGAANQPGSAQAGGTQFGNQPTSGGSVSGGTVSAPEGDADWPTIKPFLTGSP